MTSFIKGLEDDCEQNKFNNHYLSLSMPPNEVEHFNIDVISLLNTTHQWFKAEDGMGCSETSTGKISFCGRTILQENDELFLLILLFIRFYAGVPLRTDDDSTICVIDREPRDSFSKKDRESLKEFAKVVVRELEL
ncbi:13140_t:CDS:2 [Rhizophagus irregularis]|nr:13140_t:CDS:2 [Rhizophagus irregularis]